MLEHCCGDLLPFSQTIRSGLQSAFQFIPKVFDRVSVWTSLCALGHCYAETGKGLSPNCCHKVGSTESSRMSLYAVALRFPFTGTKGPSSNHEKQPQTRIPPPPNFTDRTMHWRMVVFSWHPPNTDFCELVWPTTLRLIRCCMSLSSSVWAILLPMFVYGDYMAVCSILYTCQQRVWLK